MDSLDKKKELAVRWFQELQNQICNEFIAIEDEGVPEDSEQEGLCLLYTSPSPRDLSTSRMPSSA